MESIAEYDSKATPERVTTPPPQKKNTNKQVSFKNWKNQPAPKYHTKGCSRSSVDSPGARTLVFAAFEPFSSCEFRASIARTPFCAILWRSPKRKKSRKMTQLLLKMWPKTVYMPRSAQFLNDTQLLCLNICRVKM